MKVANVILEGRFGGPQHRITVVADRLRRQGIETVVVLPRQHSTRFRSELDERDIPFQTVPLHVLSRHPRRFIPWLALFLPELIMLAIALRRIKPDIAHCNGVWQPKSVLAARLAGVPVVLHLNDSVPGLMAKLLFRLLAPLAAGFAVAGERVRETYLRGTRYESRTAPTIPAPVDTSRFDPGATKAAPIFDPEMVNVITVGNLNPGKGHLDFIAMAKELSPRHPNVVFHIVGAAFDTQRGYAVMLEESAATLPAGVVVMHGASDNVPSMLRASQIYVCSSLSEASPLGVWEAMAMELPIVSTDVGDVGLFVRDGHCGFTVPPGRPDRLAERVEALITDRSQRDRLGLEARLIAVKELDIEICARRHADLYRDLAAFDP